MPHSLTTHIARNEELWDAFVQENGGCFLQSWGWSRFQEAVGRTVYRFRIERPSQSGGEARHEDTVVQFLLAVHDLPFGFRYAYIPRGPIISREFFRKSDQAGEDPRDEEKLERLNIFLAALRDATARKGYVFARVDFPWVVGEPDVPATSEQLKDSGFIRVKDVQPTDTVIVDLADRSEDDLLAAMHQKTRYNVRLAEQKHGVVVREARRDNAHLFRHDIDLFWRMLAETSVRDIFHTHPRSYYETMLDALSPLKKVGMCCRLHFAEWQGRAVAAAITAEYGDTVTYLHGASIGEFRQKMGPHLLHWRLIQRAKADGFSKYDFWGVAPEGAGDEHRWAGITRFKVGFGGRRESYAGAWELPQSQFWYGLYRYAKRFRNI